MSDASNRSQALGNREYGCEELQRLDLPNTALKRFLVSRDLPVPDEEDELTEQVAAQLSEESIKELVQQYKYAGNQTIHYYVLTDIQSYGLEEIVEAVRTGFYKQEEAEGLPRTPFFVENDKINGRLYLTFGYFKTSGEQDVLYGSKTTDLITQRCIVVFRDDSDLVEVRTSDGNIASDIVTQIGDSLGGFRQSSLKPPEFGENFQKKFDAMVDRYTNLKVQVEAQEGSTVDVISYTSSEDESGDRQDARQDDRVKEELGRPGSEITMGYVVLEEGFRFHLNRKQSKISIRKVEREEQIAKITKLIDDVLEETGGYPQRTLRGIEDVPE